MTRSHDTSTPAAGVDTPSPVAPAASASRAAESASGGQAARTTRDRLLAWLGPLLLALVLLHFLRGAFPFAPIEGDDQAVANGLVAWLNNWDDYRHIVYGFCIQSCSYFLYQGLITLTGAAPFPVFAACNVVGAVLFLGFAGKLLSNHSGLSWTWSTLLLLGAQEISAAWSYANTSSLAGAVALAGLLTATRSTHLARSIGGGILLGLAGAFRLDALLIAPACLPLLADYLGDWKEAARTTAKVAAASLVTLLAIYAAGRVSLADAWAFYGTRGVSESLDLIRRNCYLALSLALLLGAFLGLRFLVRTADATRLGIIALGILPTLAAYGPNFTTTKYFYYALPFAVLPTAVWLHSLRTDALSASRRQFWFWILFAAAEALIGIRSTANIYRRFEYSRTGVDLMAVNLGTFKFAASLGSGEVVGTADGFRVRLGWWHAPQIYSREKTDMLAEQDRLRSLPLFGETGCVLTSTYLSNVILDGELMRRGVHPTPLPPVFPGNPSSKSTLWTHEGESLTTLLINHTPANAREFRAAELRFAPKYFLNDLGWQLARHLGVREPDWTCLSPREDGLLALYRRDPAVSP